MKCHVPALSLFIGLSSTLGACSGVNGDAEEDPGESQQQAVHGRRIGDTLPNGGTLLAGDSLYSNGFELAMQTDCNLVIYDYKDGDNCDQESHTKVVLSRGTQGRGEGCYGIMQPDGNFVIYDRQRRPIWATDTDGRGNQAELKLRPDGNMVVASGSTEHYRTYARAHPSGAPRTCIDPFAAPQNAAGFTGRFSGFPDNTQAPKDVLVVCMDAKEANGATLPPPAEIEARLGDTQRWFSAVSQGRFPIPNFHHYGCGHVGGIMVPDDQYTGSYFEDFGARAPGDQPAKVEAIMHEFRRVALETARARGFDISGFDRNGDGHIGGSELGVITVRPSGGGDGGGVRGTRVNLGSVRSVPAVDLILAANSPNPGYRQALFVHELMHLLTGAADMYDSPMFNAGYYSVMDNMEGLNWIDPFHALKLGWLNARAYKMIGRGTLDLGTMDGTGEAAILYDAKLGASEYFIVTRLSTGGVNVWRIVEDKLRMARSRYAGAYADSLKWNLWGRWAIHKLNATPLADGERFGLELVTGHTGFFVTVHRNPAEGSQKRVQVTLSR